MPVRAISRHDSGHPVPSAISYAANDSPPGPTLAVTPRAGIGDGMVRAGRILFWVAIAASILGGSAVDDPAARILLRIESAIGVLCCAVLYSAGKVCQAIRAQK